MKSRRRILLRRGLILAVVTVVWNILEGVVAVSAGLLSNSVALIGFGIDSFVEHDFKKELILIKKLCLGL